MPSEIDLHIFVPRVDVTFATRRKKMQISWRLLDLMVIQSIESNAYD